MSSSYHGGFLDCIPLPQPTPSSLAAGATQGPLAPALTSTNPFPPSNESNIGYYWDIDDGGVEQLPHEFPTEGGLPALGRELDNHVTFPDFNQSALSYFDAVSIDPEMLQLLSTSPSDIRGASCPVPSPPLLNHHAETQRTLVQEEDDHQAFDLFPTIIPPQVNFVAYLNQPQDRSSTPSLHLHPSVGLVEEDPNDLINSTIYQTSTFTTGNEPWLTPNAWNVSFPINDPSQHLLPIPTSNTSRNFALGQGVPSTAAYNDYSKFTCGFVDAQDAGFQWGGERADAPSEGESGRAGPLLERRDSATNVELFNPFFFAENSSGCDGVENQAVDHPPVCGSSKRRLSANCSEESPAASSSSNGPANKRRKTAAPTLRTRRPRAKPQVLPLSNQVPPQPPLDSVPSAAHTETRTQSPLSFVYSTPETMYTSSSSTSTRRTASPSSVSSSSSPSSTTSALPFVSLAIQQTHPPTATQRRQEKTDRADDIKLLNTSDSLFTTNGNEPGVIQCPWGCGEHLRSTLKRSNNYFLAHLRQVHHLPYNNIIDDKVVCMWEGCLEPKSWKGIWKHISNTHI